MSCSGYQQQQRCSQAPQPPSHAAHADKSQPSSGYGAALGTALSDTLPSSPLPSPRSYPTSQQSGHLPAAAEDAEPARAQHVPPDARVHMPSPRPDAAEPADPRLGAKRANLPPAPPFSLWPPVPFPPLRCVCMFT